MGTHSEDSLDTTTMYKLLIASVLAVATSLPIEDTPEVVAAKEEFNAAFAAAEAGEHINLRPVNDDAQAAQIAASYLADSEDVATAKAAFQAAFDDAAAGGLSAKQFQLQFMRSQFQLPSQLLLQLLFHLPVIHMVSTPSMFWELTQVMLLVCHMPPTSQPTHMLDSQSLLPQLPRLKSISEENNQNYLYLFRKTH